MRADQVRAPTRATNRLSARTSNGGGLGCMTSPVPRAWTHRANGSFPIVGRTRSVARKPGRVRRVAILRAVAQQVIGKHAREHGFAHRYSANADAGIVAALGGDLDLVAEAVHCGAWSQDRTGRLDREAGHDRLT